ncbi:MAG: hypothetical protein KDB00_13040 [Planctomycetales bacterium]|nr:hypothetical protein [Planctomycetales bacterium]
MNETTNPNDPLPESLQTVVAAVASDEPDPVAMHEFLDNLKQRPIVADTNAPRIAPVLETNPAIGRRTWAVIAATAAAIAIVFGLQHPPTANALEQLAQALSGQRCIHMTTTSDTETAEHWLMLEDKRSAWSSGEWIEYFDPTLDMVTTFNKQSGELVRTAGQGKAPATFLTDFVQSLVDSSRGNPPKSIRGLNITSSETLNVDGKRTLRLKADNGTVAGGAVTKSVVADIVLDESTGLPVDGHAVVNANGKQNVIDTRWDYPNNGPDSIFALGVDPKTKLVDRIPTGDVKRVVGGVYAGRLMFDDYRAVVIQGSKSDPIYYGPGDITLVGLNQKRLIQLRNFASLPSELQGKSRAEVAAAIMNDVNLCDWWPLRMFDKKAEYRFQTRIVDKNKNGETELKVDGFSRVEINLPLPEFIVPSWQNVPHFVGRPPLGVGRGDIQSMIVEEVDGGPEECVLLRTSLSGSMPEAPSDPTTTTRLTKGGYWIRANRDYLVMRTDSEFANGVATSFQIDKLAQSPRGRWYATEASTPESQRQGSVTAPTFYSYHLDFGTSLPESMFDPNHYLSDSK